MQLLVVLSICSVAAARTVRAQEDELLAHLQQQLAEEQQVLLDAVAQELEKAEGEGARKVEILNAIAEFLAAEASAVRRGAEQAKEDLRTLEASQHTSFAQVEEQPKLVQRLLSLLPGSSAFQAAPGFRGAQPSALRAPAPVAAEAPPKVVVTGMGVVSSLGNQGKDDSAFWDGLLAGKSGIGPVTAFDAGKFPTTIAGEVKDFDAKPWFNSPKTAKSVDRFTHLATATSKMAVEDAGLDLDAVDKERFGVIIGTAFGGMNTMEQQTRNEFQDKKVSPFTIPALLVNTASGIVGMELGAMGPNYAVASACAAGSHAIGDAMRMLRSGMADVMLSGGTEAAITPVSFAGFCAMKAMCSKYNDKPTEASRPFDADRAGFVMGEGAGVLLLETEAHALARGAKIYCELAGYGATCDAHHITTPHPEGKGLSDCLAKALADSGVPPEDVAYINAHGTSTAYNDKFETMAIKKVFGDHAGDLLISSTKSMTGHTLGAAGGIEAAIAAKVVQTGDVPPTINCNTADPDCDLNYVPNKAAKLDDVKAAISDNLGFGGHNAAVVFRKYEGPGDKRT